MCVAALALGLILTGVAVGAEQDEKPGQWTVTDARGAEIKGEDFYGRVTVLLLYADPSESFVLPILDDLVVQYGHRSDMALISVVDVRKVDPEAQSFAMRRLDARRLATAARVRRRLERENKPDIHFLSRKLPIVGDFAGRIFELYPHWDPKRHTTVVVLSPEGHHVGSWKLTQGADNGRTLGLVDDAIQFLLEQ